MSEHEAIRETEASLSHIPELNPEEINAQLQGIEFATGQVEAQKTAEIEKAASFLGVLRSLAQHDPYFFESSQHSQAEIDAVRELTVVMGFSVTDFMPYILSKKQYPLRTIARDLIASRDRGKVLN